MVGGEVRCTTLYTLYTKLSGNDNLMTIYMAIQAMEKVAVLWHRVIMTGLFVS